MPSASELTQSWLNSGSSGGSTNASTSPDSSAPSEHMSQASEESEESVSAENSVVDDFLAGSGDTPPDQSAKGKNGTANPSGKSDPKQTASGKEVITVTDETGKRRKVEIDYTDKESIKRAYSMMHGARKWQAERDTERASHQQTRTEAAQLKKDWGVLEEAFKKGPEELHDLLAGRRGAYKEQVAKELKRAEFLKNASPEEVNALKAREQSEVQAREIDRIRKENEDFRKEVTSQREAADLSALESRVTPVFDKYRFADKLGNADDEQLFDEMLWTTALKRLEPFESKGLEITQELADREFRAVATALRNRIGAQANKQAKNVNTQKKQEATENVQSKIKSGYKSSGGNAQEARDMINQGKLTDLLKGWNKYGSLFQKK